MKRLALSTLEASLLLTERIHFPLLEEVELRSINLHSFQHAPNLHTLSLLSIPVRNLSAFNFPWKQLAVVELRGNQLSGDKVQEIFEICTNLQELRFSLSPGDHFGYFVPPLKAPVLEKLSIILPHHSAYYNLGYNVFSSITCPALTFLHIEGSKYFDGKYRCTWPRDQLKEFISRSEHLTTLTIKSAPLADSDIIQVLIQLPSLLHLTVSDPGIHEKSPITPYLMQRLRVLGNESSTSSLTLVQKLQTLSLTFCSGTTKESFNDKDFVDMVVSRWQVPNGSGNRIESLRSVFLRFINRDPDRETYTPLKQLDEAGMKVVVLDSHFQVVV
ncbi:hypothetical protein BDP27DRAFT_54298 [Rhodocollybia butyracea]|uniref:Uncharacterized protein n=1 Tax=Rhodocollybia butyracea TaxID=206335 RepID=A0A9P5PHI9_9AGAR|nr:hypothetical protein BDP27DRAFT_54298 [Rhodocollybia butyracea]